MAFAVDSLQISPIYSKWMRFYKSLDVLSQVDPACVGTYHNPFFSCFLHESVRYTVEGTQWYSIYVYGTFMLNFTSIKGAYNYK